MELQFYTIPATVVDPEGLLGQLLQVPTLVNLASLSCKNFDDKTVVSRELLDAQSIEVSINGLKNSDDDDDEKNDETEEGSSEEEDEA